MLPVNQHVPELVVYEPLADGARRDITSFLTDMHRLLSKIDGTDPALPEMREWHHTVTTGINVKDANILQVIINSLPFLQKKLWDPLQVHTSFDRYVPPQLPSTPEFREIAVRRMCSHFICDLGRELLKYDLNDPLTQEIKNFHGLFLQALQLNKEDTQPLFERFIPILQQLLFDPFGNPLEKESVLGSDGKTYGKMSLSVYYHKLPEHLREHPPLDFDAKPIFWTQPHPIASFLINRLDSMVWKAGRSAMLVSEATLRDYTLLTQQNLVPQLPIYDDDMKERILIERMRAQQQAEIHRFAAFDQEVQAVLNHPVRQAAAKAQQGLNNMQEQVLENLDFLANHLRVQFEEVHSRQIELVAETEKLHEGIATLKAENAVLKEEVRRTGEAVAKLQVAIKEVEAAIKKHKASATGQLLQGILMVGCSIFASWALSAALQSLVGGGVAGTSSLGISSTGPKVILKGAADRIQVGVYAPPGY